MFTIQQNCETELLRLIESRLKSLPTEKVQLYFSGEFDGNQTVFEQASNELKIGVFANNTTTGMILLRFLRIIIDERPDLLIADVLDEFNDEPKDYGDEICISDLIETLAEKEEQYSDCFSLGDEISRTLSKWTAEHGVVEEKLVVELENVETWSLPRIMNKMYKMYA